MRKSVKKAVTLGIAGVTVLNGLPVNALALNTDDVVEFKECENNSVEVEVEGFPTSLSLNGKAFFDENSGTLYISKGSVFSLGFDGEVSEIKVDGVSLATRDFSCEDIGISSLVEFVFEERESVEVSLLSYLLAGYGNVSNLVIVDNLGTFGFRGLDDSKAVKVSDHYISGVLEFLFDVSKDVNIPLDVYGCDVQFGGQSISDSFVTLSEDGSVLSVKVDLDSVEFSGLEGGYALSILVGNNLSEGYYYTNSINIDNTCPEVELGFGDLFNSGDGKVYLGLDDNGMLPLVLKVKDNGLGTVEDSLVVEYDTFRIVSKTDENGYCEVNFSVSIDDFKSDKVIKVFDNEEGNSYEIPLKSLCGFDLDNVVFGIPSTSLSVDFSGNYEMLENWIKGDISMGIEVSNSLGLSSLEYIINGNSVIVDFEDYTSHYSDTVSLADLENSNGLVDLIVKATDSKGVTSSYIETMYVDNKLPYIKGKGTSLDESDYHVHNGVAYVGEDISLKGTVLDNASGVKYLEVLKDGVKVSDTLDYKITSSGSYTFRVVDNVGNSREYKLCDFTDLDFDYIVIDKSEPIISEDKLDGVSKISDGLTWYKGVNNLEFSISGGSLDTVEVMLDGIVIYSGMSDNSLFNVDLGSLSDGKHTYSIKLTSYTGKVFSKVVDFYVDNSCPVISSLSLDGGRFLDGKMWFKDVVTLKVNSLDNGIGIAKYILSDAKGNEIRSSKGNFTLDSGAYYIQVVDELGNKTDKISIGEFLGWGTNDILVDNVNPSVNIVKPDTSVKDTYSDSVDLQLAFSDNKGIHRYKVLVNDVLMYEKVYSGDLPKSDDYTLSILENMFIDNIYNISIEIEDGAGNKYTCGDLVKIDNVAPEFIKHQLSDSVLDSKHGVFFKSNPTLTLKADDNMSGVEEYVLVGSDGNEFASTDGKFILHSGEYQVRVVDKIGNKSSLVPLKDLLSLNSNSIVVDSDKPSIEASKPLGDTGNWYSKDISLSVSLKDSVSLRSGSLSINGVVLDSFSDLDGYTKNIVLSANTSSIKSDDYKYNIKVDVVDSSGNANSWGDTIYIDKVAPKITSSTLSVDYNDKQYGVFFTKKPKLVLEASDNGVGFDEFVLLSEDGSEVSRSKDSFELSTGSYYIKAIDKLGNETKPVSVKDLLGLTSNALFVDSSKPVIECSRPEGSVKGWFSGNVVYDVTVSDNVSLESVSVVINGVKVDGFNTVKGQDTRVTLLKFKADTSKVKANDDGSYDISISACDSSGNECDMWSDKIYIDSSSPVIDKFVVTAEGYNEGSEIRGSDEYGFYVQGATSVDVYVSDGSITSGLKNLCFTITDSDGNVESGTESIINGVARINLPKSFKGFVSAFAEDNVGNKGKVSKPDGIISNGGNTQINSTKIDLVLPEAVNKDSKGRYLYNKDVKAEIIVENKYSGIRYLEWGVGDTVLGSASIDNNGKVVGGSLDVYEVDKNLVIKLGKDFVVDSNSNNIKVWIKAVDRLGYISDADRVISIDKDSPVISVTYDETFGSNYYAKDRVATIMVVERNFSSSDVKLLGNYGTLGSWQNIGNDTWVNTITFSRDDDYQWSLEYVDMAGNKGNTYSSERFTIDKTKPIMTVSFDNNSYKNEGFYNNFRTAKVIINEHNFDSSLVSFVGSGTLSGWVSNGDEHVASITFDRDGEYEFTISSSDKAGNMSNTFNSKFIIDTKAPVVDISGVQDGVSYKKEVSFRVNISDDYIDSKLSSVTLVGRSVGELDVTGQFNDKTGEFIFSGVPNDAKYDDLYTLNVSVYDNSGNLTSKSIRFSVNRFGSSYKFSNDDLIGAMVGSADDITISEYSVDRLDVSKAKIVVIRDGIEISVDRSLLNIKEYGGVTSNWVYDYYVSRDVFKEDGKYTIQVYSVAEDGTGNSSLSQEYSFILDTTKPEVIISGVNSGEIYNEVSKKVSIDVRDLSGIQKLEVLLNGKEVKPVDNGGIYYITVEENNSVQELVVTAVDMVGNVSTIVVDDFLVTSSLIRSLLHQSWVKWLLSAIIGFIALVCGILFKRRRDAKAVEKLEAEDNAKMYMDSTTGSSSSSNKTSS